MKINYLVANFWASTVLSLWCTVLIFLTTFSNVVLDMKYNSIYQNGMRINVGIKSINIMGDNESNFGGIMLYGLAIFLTFFTIFMYAGSLFINKVINRPRPSSPLILEEEIADIENSINSDYMFHG